MTSRAQVLVKCVSYWSKVKFRVERRLENRWAGGRGEQVGGGGGGGYLAVNRHSQPAAGAVNGQIMVQAGQNWSKLVKTGCVGALRARSWACRGAPEGRLLYSLSKSPALSPGPAAGDRARRWAAGRGRAACCDDGKGGAGEIVVEGMRTRRTRKHRREEQGGR